VPAVARLRDRTRLLAGLGLLLLARVLFVLRPAGSPVLLAFIDVLSGVDQNAPHILYEDYALLPLAAMFLIGSAMGRRFARAERAGQLRELAVRYLLAAPALAAASILLLGVWLLVRHGGPAPLPAFVYPDYDFSTYPLYLAGVVTVMGLLLLRHGRAGPAERFFAVFGRTSLVTYVAEYYLVQALPLLVGWRHNMTLLSMAVYLPGAIWILNLLAGGYERARAARRNQRRPVPPPWMAAS
jgi:hypothetical protein